MGETSVFSSRLSPNRRVIVSSEAIPSTEEFVHFIPDVTANTFTDNCPTLPDETPTPTPNEGTPDNVVCLENDKCYLKEDGNYYECINPMCQEEPRPLPFPVDFPHIVQQLEDTENNTPRMSDLAQVGGVWYARGPDGSWYECTDGAACETPSIIDGPQDLLDQLNQQLGTGPEELYTDDARDTQYSEAESLVQQAEQLSSEGNFVDAAVLFDQAIRILDQLRQTGPIE